MNTLPTHKWPDGMDGGWLYLDQSKPKAQDKAGGEIPESDMRSWEATYMIILERSTPPRHYYPVKPRPAHSESTSSPPTAKL